MLFTRILAPLGVLVLLATAACAQDSRSFTDDLGRVVDVPVRPLSVVALDDLRLTVPLLELDVVPVGSHGRVRDDGSTYIRAGLALTGVDFANSAITFVGDEPADLEAIAALRPDLIITLTSRSSPVDLLEAIAPTVVLDEAKRPPFAIYDVLADLTGTQKRLDRLKARYRAQLDLIAAQIDVSKTSVAVIEGADGAISARHTYGSLGTILRDAGFQMPAIIDAIPLGAAADFSAERLPDFNADYVFDTFRSDRGETPADAIERMNAVLPDFCAFLPACAAGHYIIVSRDEAYAVSFQSLSLMSAVILSNIAGRYKPAHP